MQSVSSRIWTLVAVSISYDDNRYTTGTSQIILLLVYLSSDINVVEIFKKSSFEKVLFLLSLCWWVQLI